jgi:PhnB protein
MPPEHQKKIMHATFNGPGFTFMVSDGHMGKTIDPEAGNISLSLATSGATESERVLKALSCGGKVAMPLQDGFWGGKFGQLVDRFGVE